MANKQYQTTVNIPSGYYLESGEEKGFLSVYIPEQGDNIVPNPTMEDIEIPNGYPDGYFFGLGGIDYGTGGPFWKNFWTLYFSDSLGTQFASTNTITSQTLTGSITASVWVRRPVGKTPSDFKITLTYADNTTNVITTATSGTFTPVESWQQFSITAPRSATAVSKNFSVRITGMDLGYLDWGFTQLEASSYPTSAIHGYGEESAWLGTPFASTSRRYKTALCGGRLVNLKDDLGLRLIELTGLGLPKFDHVAQPYAFDYGSLFQCVTLENREYEMTFLLHSCSLQDLMCKRNAIGRAIFEPGQPRCFVWTPTDCDDKIGDNVCFTGVLSDGFDMGFKSQHGEEIKLTFVDYNTRMSMCQVTTCQLPGESAVTHTGIVGVGEDGTPFIFPSFASISPAIHRIDGAVISPYDGNLYVAVREGVFAPFTGKVLRYDGVSWASVATTVGNNVLTALEGIGKYLYVGVALSGQLAGDAPFTGSSGNGIARINLATKTVENIGNLSATLTAGVDGLITVQPIIRDFVADTMGNVYVGGAFAGISNGVSSTTFDYMHLAVFSSTNRWSSTGLQIAQALQYRGSVNTLLYDKDTLRLYVGGTYSSLPMTIAFFPNIFSYVQMSSASDTVGTAVRTDFPLYDGTGQLETNRGIVNKIVKYKNRIFIGGDFTSSYGYDLEILDSFAYYDETWVGPESVKGRLYPPSNYGINYRYARNTGIPSINPVEDMIVCDGSITVVGKFIEIVTHNGNFIPVHEDDACGVAVYTATGSSGETGVMKPGTISFGAQGATPLLTCYGTLATCGSEKLGLAATYISSQVDGVNQFITSEIVIPENCKICDGDLAVSPIIFLRGSMLLTEIKNYTSSTSLFFDLNILEDEYVIIDLTGTPKITSSTNGDITSQFLPSSAPSAFTLNPGDNYLGLFTTQFGDKASANIYYNRKSFDVAQLACNNC